jgi:2-polyprenyl-6-methoxyphenol hydroxylase-like FAD-dependent oxidoreductase
MGERIRVGRRAERFRGSPDLPSYLRQPYGPGWALVGDAGLLLDPITGQGISHAFRDAELLADAVADGLGGIRPLAEALARYHRARDRAARPMYDFTARLAAVSPPTPAETALFRAIARRQEDADMFLGVLAGSIPLRQFMSPRTMVRLVGAGGFARLALAQARPHRTAPAAGSQLTEGSSARSAENASAT